MLKVKATPKSGTSEAAPASPNGQVKIRLVISGRNTIETVSVPSGMTLKGVVEQQGIQSAEVRVNSKKTGPEYVLQEGDQVTAVAVAIRGGRQA